MRWFWKFQMLKETMRHFKFINLLWWSEVRLKLNCCGYSWFSLGLYECHLISSKYSTILTWSPLPYYPVFQGSTDCAERLEEDVISSSLSNDIISTHSWFGDPNKHKYLTDEVWRFLFGWEIVMGKGVPLSGARIKDCLDDLKVELRWNLSFFPSPLKI